MYNKYKVLTNNIENEPRLNDKTVNPEATKVSLEVLSAERVQKAQDVLSDIETIVGINNIDSTVAEFVKDTKNLEEVADLGGEVGALEILENADNNETANELAERPLEPLVNALKDIDSFLGPESTKIITDRIDDATASQVKQEKDVLNVDNIEKNNQNTAENSANYMGNWANIQHERMKSESFLKKLRYWTSLGAASLPNERVEKEMASNEYAQHADIFEGSLGYVNSSIQYDNAAVFGKEPTKLGISIDFGEPPILFKDAPLNDRQKDVIAAHEIYHSLIRPQGNFANKITAGFDTNVIKNYNEEQRSIGKNRVSSKYMQKADELTARMAQIKNYFGMTDSEAFTKEHLEYAKKHYVEDINYDNNMTVFFRMIIDEPFIKNMNSMPI